MVGRFLIPERKATCIHRTGGFTSLPKPHPFGFHGQFLNTTGRNTFASGLSLIGVSVKKSIP